MRSLITAIEVREKEIRTVLERPRAPGWPGLLGLHKHPELMHPERMKALTRIAARLVELQRILELSDSDEPWPLQSAKNLVERATGELGLDAAWELAEELRIELLWFQPNESLWAQLEESQRTRPVAGDRWASGYLAENMETLRKQYLEHVLKGLRPPRMWRSLTVEVLASRYRAWIESFRHARALARLRARYFLLLLLVLSIVLSLSVLALLGVGAASLSAPRQSLFVALATGALGAVLSGVYRLRDRVKSIRDLHSSWATYLIQPFIGATAGLLLFVVLRSGYVKFGNFEPARLHFVHYAVLGFVAGFAEPFLLGIVGRISHLGEERENAGDKDGGDKDGGDKEGKT
ncbi:hypothetical protein F0U60_07835 [Archangium minus]|uniref:Uncharacterized protein n=1 Tax=Archangium minus TaxID=83450 RepID=A0ABY9WK98_9BACT|nr:hypothetical protein F0U60_07835 [Archangium minus]